MADPEQAGRDVVGCARGVLEKGPDNVTPPNRLRPPGVFGDPRSGMATGRKPGACAAGMNSAASGGTVPKVPFASSS